MTSNDLPNRITTTWLTLTHTHNHSTFRQKQHSLTHSEVILARQKQPVTDDAKVLPVTLSHRRLSPPTVCSFLLFSRVIVKTVTTWLPTHCPGHQHNAHRNIYDRLAIKLHNCTFPKKILFVSWIDLLGTVYAGTTIRTKLVKAFKSNSKNFYVVVKVKGLILQGESIIF